GRAVGSRIRLAGRMLGIDLHVEAAVIAREPSKWKSWETVGEPRLLVIGHYRMSVRIEPRGDSSNVTIGIDYRLPTDRPMRWLGRLFGPMYARWCVQQMARDLVNEFGAART